MNAPLLQVEKLTLVAGERHLLRDCSFTVTAGELIGIIGPNGAGKSSLLKGLAGLVRPSAGAIRLAGKALHEFSAIDRARQLAYLEQQPQVCWPLAAHEIVALGLLNHGLSQSEIEARVSAALQASGCAELAQRRFDTLSAGERMQVHLARLFAANTPLLLADEPTAALDLWHQHHLMQSLRRRCEAGQAVVVVLHDLALAARYCARLLLFDKGELIKDGVPKEVLQPALLERSYNVCAFFDARTGTLVHTHNL